MFFQIPCTDECGQEFSCEFEPGRDSTWAEAGEPDEISIDAPSDGYCPRCRENLPTLDDVRRAGLEILEADQDRAVEAQAESDREDRS